LAKRTSLACSAGAVFALAPYPYSTTKSVTAGQPGKLGRSVAQPFPPLLGDVRPFLLNKKWNQLLKIPFAI